MFHASFLCLLGMYVNNVPSKMWIFQIFKYFVCNSIKIKAFKKKTWLKDDINNVRSPHHKISINLSRLSIISFRISMQIAQKHFHRCRPQVFIETIKSFPLIKQAQSCSAASAVCSFSRLAALMCTHSHKATLSSYCCAAAIRQIVNRSVTRSVPFLISTQHTNRPILKW